MTDMASLAHTGGKSAAKQNELRIRRVRYILASVVLGKPSKIILLLAAHPSASSFEDDPAS